MRTKDEIRDELLRELETKGINLSILAIEYEVDARFHWERVISEAEDIERKYGSARIEFIATPDDVRCRQCFEMNGKSLTLDELKAQGSKLACRCAIVLPDHEMTD